MIAYMLVIRVGFRSGVRQKGFLNIPSLLCRRWLWQSRRIRRTGMLLQLPPLVGRDSLGYNHDAFVFLRSLIVSDLEFHCGSSRGLNDSLAPTSTDKLTYSSAESSISCTDAEEGFVSIGELLSIPG